MIVASALELDLDRLSMHELAERLGVAHSALYRWIGGRDELLGLVSDVMIARIHPAADPVDGDWRAWLADMAWAMRREFLAVPGFAMRIVNPHEHSDAYDSLQQQVVDVLVEHVGVSADLARQSWYVFGTSVVGWLAVEQNRETPLEPAPRFDLLVDTILRGLPVRDPPEMAAPTS